MEFIKTLFIICLHIYVAQSFIASHLSLKDALSDRAIMHELTHNHPSYFKRHEASNISKILKFQMKKILHDHDTHLNQGNMNRSHRAEFEKNLKSKFNNIRKYTQRRLRKDQEDKTRRRRSRNQPRRRGPKQTYKNRAWQAWNVCCTFDGFCHQHLFGTRDGLRVQHGHHNKNIVTNIGSIGRSQSLSPSPINLTQYSRSK